MKNKARLLVKTLFNQNNLLAFIYQTQKLLFNSTEYAILLQSGKEVKKYITTWFILQLTSLEGTLHISLTGAFHQLIMVIQYKIIIQELHNPESAMVQSPFSFFNQNQSPLVH